MNIYSILLFNFQLPLVWNWNNANHLMRTLSWKHRSTSKSSWTKKWGTICHPNNAIMQKAVFAYLSCSMNMDVRKRCIFSMKYASYKLMHPIAADGHSWCTFVFNLLNFPPEFLSSEMRDNHIQKKQHAQTKTTSKSHAHRCFRVSNHCDNVLCMMTKLLHYEYHYQYNYLYHYQ